MNLNLINGIDSWLFGGLYDVLKFAVIIAGVVGVIYVLVKFEGSRKYIGYGLVALLFVSALICGYKSYNYFTATGNNFGEFMGTILDSSSGSYLGDLTFQVDNIAFVYNENTEEYQAELHSTKEDLKSIDLTKNYEIQVNEDICSIIRKGKEYITCQYSYVFYNDNLQEIKRDTLYIKFAFYNNYFSLKMSTKGNEDTIDLWENYINKHNLIIKLVETDFVRDTNINALETYGTISFSLNFEDTESLNILNYDDYVSIKSDDMIVLNDYDNQLFSLDKTWQFDNLLSPINVLCKYGTYTYELKLSDSFVVDSLTRTFTVDKDNTNIVIDINVKEELNTLIVTYDNGSVYKVKNIETIGLSTFDNHENVVSVSIPITVKKIGTCSFENTKIETIEIPNTVTSIDFSAFSKCKNLNNVFIPGSVENWGNEVFSGCSSLTNITFEDTVKFKKFGRNMFLSTSINQLNIPYGVTELQQNVFEGCPLKVISIPSTVTFIAGNFKSGSLNTINFKDTMAVWNSIIKGYDFAGGKGPLTVFCIDGYIDYPFASEVTLSNFVGSYIGVFVNDYGEVIGKSLYHLDISDTGFVIKDIFSRVVFKISDFTVEEDNSFNYAEFGGGIEGGWFLYIDNSYLSYEEYGSLFIEFSYDSGSEEYSSFYFIKK